MLLTTWFLVILSMSGSTNVLMESRFHCFRAIEQVQPFLGSDDRAFCLSTKGFVATPPTPTS